MKTRNWNQFPSRLDTKSTKGTETTF